MASFMLKGCTKHHNRLGSWALVDLQNYKAAVRVVDVLWGQSIKLIQVASNSELRENQWNDLLFFEIVPSHCFGGLRSLKN